MRAYFREFICTAVLLAAFAATAKAEEQLVMPFGCRADGGRVLLSPAPPQSYRIVGAHERRDFSTCSPKRSGRCRSFDLHRFEIDCGGVKASWLSVVAALAPWSDRPNPIRAGRMQIAVGPRHYGASMPCIVPMPYGPPGFYRPRLMVWPCPGGPAAPRRLVDLPAGFAPIPSRLVGFTSVPDPVAHINAPPAPSADKFSSASSAPPPQASKEHSSGIRHAQGTGSKIAKESLPAHSPSAIPFASAQSETTGAIPAPAGTASGWTRRNLMGAAVSGFAALLFFGTALLLSRRRSKAVQIVAPSQAPAGIDILALNAGAQTPQGPALSARLPTEDEWLPSTLGEALIVLCANPETERDMLKELVKGLRLRWHPDHALNEADRRARECKLKRINVAWDIVCGKRRVRRAPARSRAA